MTNQKQIVLTTKMTTENKESEPQKTGTKENIVFIGGKPFMNYVTGVVMQFNTHNAPEVIVKARGKFISKAVDVSEVARRKFLVDQKITVKEIKIDSEEFENKEGRTVNVSIMDIVLKKS
jgi:DNA-binding protein|tara:strand:+ start:1969 stop:2328 length:360 start_codon:yes stop_codon:yes gene_type:complete